MLCLLAIFLTAIAAAAPVAVEVQLHEHEAALIEVRTATGATVFDARIMDGSARDGFGWLPDLSDESGTVRATLPALFVEEGEYRLHIQTPDGTTTRSVAVSPSFTRQIPVRVPSGATAVRGVRDRGGPPAVVWVPTDDRTDIVLPIGDGEWSLWADNAPGLTGRVNPIQTGPVLMTERPRVWPRTPSTTLGWVVAGLLLPVTILLGAAGIWGLNRLLVKLLMIGARKVVIIRVSNVFWICFILQCHLLRGDATG